MNQSKGVLLISPQVKDSTHSFTLSVFNDDYSQPETVSLHPWDFIVEPLRRTTIKITDSIAPNGLTYWKFSRLNKQQNVETFIEDYGSFDSSIEILEQGSSYLILNFKDAGIIYQMDITEYSDSTKAETIRTSSYQVASKFVRREIRQMTDSDRTNFFDGLELMHRLTLEVGKELYGEHFRNSKHFALKHLDRYAQLRCTPYHGGDVFFTSHAAFSLAYERSLQSMFPELAFPYWDFSLDDYLYGTNWTSSPIFSDDWFSPMVSSTEEENYAIAKGRFAYTSVPINYDSAEHNSYGRISVYLNNNPSKYASRSDSMCGLTVDVGNLPGCNIVSELIEKHTFSDFHIFTENEFHTRLHSLLGGYWNCKHKWSEWTDTHASEWKLFMHHFAQTFELGFTAGGFNLTCPLSCEEGEVCSCECKDLSKEILNMKDQSLKEQLAYDQINDWGSLKNMFTLSPTNSFLSVACSYDTDNCTIHNYIKDLPPDEQGEFWPWLLEQMCTPPTFSEFSSPFAAPFDPLFMPSHHNFIRWWTYYRILVSEYSNTYEYSWGEDSACWGHTYQDNIGFGTTDIGKFPTTDNEYFTGEHFYSNQELDEIFHPFHSDLPYIFGSYDLSYCE